MQAIVTKFIPGNNKYPSGRIRATAQAGSLIIEWRDMPGGYMGNHKTAAMALVHRLGWGGFGKWFDAGLPDGSTVWVCDDTRTSISFDLRPESNVA